MAMKNLVVRIGGDFSDLQKKMESAQKELGKMGNKMKSAGTALSVGITAPVIGIGVASMNAAATFQESQGRMSSVLGTLAGDAGKFAKDFSNKFGISQTAINDHLSSMSLMGTNYGLTSDEAYKMSQSMTQITADTAAFNNMGFDETSERLGAALRGEGEAAEALGLSINQTTLAEYAKQQGMTKSISQMSQAELMQLRYGLIMEQTAKMSGTAEKESSGYAATMQKLQTAVENAMIPVGQILIPLITTLAEKVQAAAEWFSGLDDKTKKIVIVLAGLAALLGPLLLLLGAMATAVAAISLPMIIAVAGIAAMIAIGVLLYKNWDSIKAYAASLGTSIATTFNNIKNSITDKINGAKDIVKNAIDAIKGFFSFKFSWPNMPMPHFSVNPPGWKIGDLVKGSIPSLGVSWYDKGGIFNGPSVIGVGEKRPEFVGALDDLRYIVRDEVGGGSANIIVELDGYTIAKAIGQPLTDLIRVKTGLRI